ncbi:hypothetical protein SBI_00949 [Streptomyces bingchenggensis BCW-1]|uniref:Nitroreductase domain-containing protein n=1 Tax=Streptomyces bingchenggensis (strain BCW-1) TaxID=749414 RepID=D7C682_STRBB|nr:hypothetical protein SBI_00949 [Streptomyces bingchenggensis BCW-1]
MPDERLLAAWLDMTELPPVPRLEVEEPRSQGLRQAVRVVTDALLGRPAQEGRQVPSAGAIYPYDVLVLVDEGDRPGDSPGPALFWMDLLRRTCVRLGGPATRLGRLLRPARLPDGGEPVAHVILLARPWLSMRKYGSRGYLYTQLDAGHAATNLLGTALQDGPAVLRLHGPRAEIRAAVAPWLPHREVHSVVTIGRPHTTGESGDWATFRMAGDDDPAGTGQLEGVCWSGLSEAVYDSSQPFAASARLHTAAPMATELRPSASDGIPLAQWREASRRRQSCKRFSGDTPEPHALLSTLGALDTPLPADLAEVTPDRGVRATLLLHDGPTAKACSDTLRGSRIDVTVPDRFRDLDLLVRSCMGQANARVAAGFVLFHIPRDELFSSGPRDLRDAVFRASCGAHLLCLGAGRHSVAITTIGGYDPDLWREFAGLSAWDEPLYLLALGVDQAGSIKHDRAQVAYAHGE